MMLRLDGKVFDISKNWRFLGNSIPHDALVWMLMTCKHLRENALVLTSIYKIGLA